jgi:lysophospholipase L1-like esterase
MRWLLLPLLIIFPLLSAFAQDECPGMRMPPVAVPHLRHALRAGESIVIVALGSSSTRSYMSSNPGHSYPAVLQTTLTAALPRAEISVINRGVNGQDAAEEVRRLDADVLALRPQAVIWQVGANGVLRNSDPATFKLMVADGVKRLQQAGIDVVLMDNQRSQRILAKPDHLLMDQALAEVAVQTGVSLFSRAALMDAWQKGGTPYETFISSDNLHQNDLGYHCVAEALATSILDGIGPPTPTQALAQSH